MQLVELLQGIYITNNNYNGFQEWQAETYEQCLCMLRYIVLANLQQSLQVER
ncbi:MAG: hypothetical protein KAT61_03160 [Gammaproteobacteria bacterium]|nr:hypothetical protein [Gammaproteobacteria bacterium]